MHVFFSLAYFGIVPAKIAMIVVELFIMKGALEMPYFHV
jgi:hypothetical protein